MKRRKFLIWLAKAWGGYFGLAAVGTLPPLLKINTVRLGEAQAAISEPCVCEAADGCICEAADLVVCPSDGHSEPCVPDVCTVQDGCTPADATVRVCRVSDSCGTDLTFDCRSDSCDTDLSGECVGDTCTADSSGDCNGDNCTGDSSGACLADQCPADSSGACLTDACTSDKSGGCQNDNCVSDKSGTCLSDACDADSSGPGWTDSCESDSSGSCRVDTCAADSSGSCDHDTCSSDSSKSCITDQCTSDSSGACNTDAGDADSSGACASDTCTSDKSGGCTSDRCNTDSSGPCATQDVCVKDVSADCTTDLCREDVGGICATRDVCASDVTPAAAQADLNHALRWLYRLSMLLLALSLAPDEALAATVIDASDAQFGTTPVFQTAQAVGAPDFAGAFIRDCDGDGIEEADTNGDGNCTGDPELRDYNADGSRELPNGTPFAGSFQFACFHVPVDVALITSGPVAIASAGDVGIYGSVYYAGNFTLAAAGSIDLRTSAWMADTGGAATFRTALSGEVDQTQNDYSETPLPDLAFNGVCAATLGAQEIPGLSPWGLTLLGGLLAVFAWGSLRGERGASGRRG